MAGANPTAKLMSASKDDNVEAVRALLAAGVPANASNGIGQTSLHVAALWGCVEVARVLIDAGASLSVANQFGATPLHFAAQNKRLEMARLLVERGADTMARAGNGTRPYEMAEGELRTVLGGPSNAMHDAVKLRDVDGLRALLDQGGDVTEPNGEGRTPVHLAALTALADATQGGGSAFGMAALQMLVEAARGRGGGALVAACGALDDSGVSPLHVLVQGQHRAGVELLLDAGADPDVACHAREDTYRSGNWSRQTAGGKEALESADRTALHMAVEAGSEELSLLLLEAKADPNARDLERRTPLHVALISEEHEQRLGLAALLLERRGDPSLGNTEVGVANSCLHVAAARNDAAAVQLLLQHGAAHSAAGKGGFSPLAVAARAGALLAIPPLLEAGADPDAPTAAGKSARELAVINKRLQAIQLFDAR